MSMGAVEKVWLLKFLDCAKFKDWRLVKRFGLILEALIQRPEASIPAANASWASTKGAYRFFANQNVEASEIRNTFINYTCEQIKDESMVLVINDTTEIGYGAHRKIKAGGYVSTPDSNGVFLHSAMIISEKEVPEGLIYQKHWIRDRGEFGKSKNCANRRIEDKESYCWIEVLEATQKQIPESTAALVIGDRGSDIFELFACPRRENIHLLVRAAHNRAIENTEHAHLFDIVNAQPIAKTITITVRGKQHKNREATVEIRYARANLKRPAHLKETCPESIQMSIIAATEISVPEGESPIDWKLITSMNIDSADVAIKLVKFYSLRWIIERYHYTLKSGCQVEELQLESPDGLEKALATYCIVAWRLMYMTYLARKDPELPCTEVLSDDEWKALCCFTSRMTRPPSSPPSLQDAIILIAKLGGFLARKHDGNPGLMVIWRGLRRLDDITETYCIFAQMDR